MRLSLFGIAIHKSLGVLALTIMATHSTPPGHAAITVGHVDDFQDGTTQHWRIGRAGGSYPENVANAGPQGAGDHSLFHTNSGLGSPQLLIVLNDDAQSVPGPGNWEGNWTAAGVTQITLDVRSPGAVAGASALTMRLGIAGPGGVSGGGSGDAYYTDGISVAADNTWHTITFDVVASDWNAIGENIALALTDVTQFRIYSNPVDAFIGGESPNEFYLDNIRAIGAPTMLAGDYNQNGAVDAADYVLWQDTRDQSVTPGSGADGTGSGGAPDGVVNELDYDFWRARLGNTAASTSAAGIAVVPEPAALSLLILSTILFALQRSERRRRRNASFR
jgi:hypothetical protein